MAFLPPSLWDELRMRRRAPGAARPTRKNSPSLQRVLAGCCRMRHQTKRLSVQPVMKCSVLADHPGFEKRDLPSWDPNARKGGETLNTRGPIKWPRVRKLPHAVMYFYVYKHTHHPLLCGWASTISGRRRLLGRKEQAWTGRMLPLDGNKEGQEEPMTNLAQQARGLGWPDRVKLAVV